MARATGATIAFYEIWLTATSRVKRFYLRDEFAPNTRAAARRYASLEDAQLALQGILATGRYNARLEGYGTIGVSA